MDSDHKYKGSRAALVSISARRLARSRSRRHRPYGPVSRRPLLEIDLINRLKLACFGESFPTILSSDEKATEPVEQRSGRLLASTAREDLNGALELGILAL